VEGIYSANGLRKGVVNTSKMAAKWVDQLGRFRGGEGKTGSGIGKLRVRSVKATRRLGGSGDDGRAGLLEHSRLGGAIGGGARESPAGGASVRISRRAANDGSQRFKRAGSDEIGPASNAGHIWLAQLPAQVGPCWPCWKINSTADQPNRCQDSAAWIVDFCKHSAAQRAEQVTQGFQDQRTAPGPAISETDTAKAPALFPPDGPVC
jgi:hypothetical protein